MTILKGIPRILPPRLLYALASMGHGDMIVLADANFPATSVAKANNAELIRCDALTVPQVLEAICKLMPVDRHMPYPAAVMAVVPQDVGKVETPVSEEFRRIIKDAEKRDVNFEEIERMEFYERAKKAYAVVATGESALYGNLILYKGVLGPNE